MWGTRKEIQCKCIWRKKQSQHRSLSHTCLQIICSWILLLTYAMANNQLFADLRLRKIKIVFICFTVQQLQRGLHLRTINPSSWPDIVIPAYPCSSADNSKHNGISWKLEFPDILWPSHWVSFQVCHLDILWCMQEAVCQSGQFLSNQIQDELTTTTRNLFESSCGLQRIHQLAWHCEKMP